MPETGTNPLSAAESCTAPPAAIEVAERVVVTVGIALVTTDVSPDAPHVPAVPAFVLSPAKVATHMYEPANAGVYATEVYVRLPPVGVLRVEVSGAALSGVAHV